MNRDASSPPSLLRVGAPPGSPRGRLRILLGYAPGSGKTTRLLEEARTLRANNVDVALAFVDLKSRDRDEALTEGLEVLPKLELEFHGVKVGELHLEAVIKRHPHVAVVDDAAHTNAPLCESRTRAQDIERLLNAGINVLCATEVRHLSRIQPLIHRLTGNTARDTLSDRFLRQAEELIALDLAPEVLRLRSQQLKGPPFAPPSRYLEPGVLEALRELMLREVVEHLERRGTVAPQDAGSPLAARRRVMVCMSSRSPIAKVLLLRGARMAGRLNTTFYAAYVETPEEKELDAETEQHLLQSINFAQELGAEVCRLRGVDPVAVLIDFAYTHGVGHILLGRTHQPRWRQVLGRTFVHRMVREALAFDLQIVSLENPEFAS